MDETLGRRVTVAVTFAGHEVGIVGPFDVASPWWADVEPVVDHVRAVLGVNVAALRLVDVEGGVSPRNGHVTYHVEALAPPAQRLSSSIPPTLSRALVAPADNRAAWATAAGLHEALAWAQRELRHSRPSDNGGHGGSGSGSGSGEDGVVEQVKTWNLSGVFRIRTGTESAWLKVTPPFATDEVAVTGLIASVDPDLVPRVLAADPTNRRALLAHVPGEDSWDASPAPIHTTIGHWVAAQSAISTDTLPDNIGVPERRPTYLIDGLAGLLDGEAGAQLDAAEMTRARELQHRLPEMIGELEACGLPYTLVHGDFHPGNWRFDGDHTVLVDFADAYFGNPVFDGERLRLFVGPERARPVIDGWCEAWTKRAPRSDPRRALALGRILQPIAGAILYQMFLDHIEPSERRYHELDPPAGLRDAITAES